MSSLTKDQIISSIYYDLETGYGSAKNTFEQARQKDKSITLEYVQKWMKQQPNKQRKAYRNSNSYTAAFARFEYQMEIMDMVTLHKSEIQPRYAIVVTDLFSKLGEALPTNE